MSDKLNRDYRPSWGLGLTIAEIERQCPVWLDERFWPVKRTPPDLEASAPCPDPLAALREPPEGDDRRLERSASQTGGK